MSIIRRFDEALASADSKTRLLALAQELKEAGHSQIEVYVLFEQFIELAQRLGRENDMTALGEVGCRVWGWGDALFPSLLTEAQVAEYKRQQLKQNQSVDGAA